MLCRVMYEYVVYALNKILILHSIYDVDMDSCHVLSCLVLSAAAGAAAVALSTPFQSEKLARVKGE